MAIYAVADQWRRRVELVIADHDGHIEHVS